MVEPGNPESRSKATQPPPTISRIITQPHIFQDDLPNMLEQHIRSLHEICDGIHLKVPFRLRQTEEDSNDDWPVVESDTYGSHGAQQTTSNTNITVMT